MTIRPKFRTGTAAAALLAALSLTWIAPSAQADAPAASAAFVPSGSDCGWHTERFGVYEEAHYRHCTNEPYSVRITILYGNGTNGGTCVNPNVDLVLGPYGPFGVIYAYYNGSLC
ncbi:DUF6355 family natural product biosynthesis protein [Streptodolium elevatio]|uniref:DUF6355 family natural product biosynthesis protein n=1 Tax=Streptodolium elevatio TaxID=3157996 RepID=A0ABV3DM06_9ACTN